MKNEIRDCIELEKKKKKKQMPKGETKKQMGGWPRCFVLRDGNSTYKCGHTDKNSPQDHKEINKIPQKLEEDAAEQQQPKEMSGSSSSCRSSDAAKLKSSSSELDLDRPNIEDYLPSGVSIQQEPHGKLHL